MFTSAYFYTFHLNILISVIRFLLNENKLNTYNHKKIVYMRLVLMI
jgi:hypothetical protein